MLFYVLASSISQGSGAGWPGALFRGPTWLTARLRMSSDLRLLILSDSSHSDFFSRCYSSFLNINYTLQNDSKLLC